MWIDDVQQQSITGIDNDTRRVTQVDLGAVSGVDRTAAGTTYFDAVEVRQSSYIGPVICGTGLALQGAAITLQEVCVQPTPTPTPTPTFTPTPGVPTPTPFTPVPGGCDLTITEGGKIRLGPSVDNFIVTIVNSTTQMPAYAKAIDEGSLTWYGVMDANRPGYLSWIADTPYITLSDETACANLPDRSIPPDNNWQDILMTATISAPPLQEVDNTRNFRGFGIDDAVKYPSVYNCQHPGFDFIPSGGVWTVYAITDGIVVGMGALNDTESTRPDAWGAITGGFSLIVRTGNRFILYGELSQIHPAMYVGERIHAGQEIGQASQTEGHVHIEIRGYGGDSTTGLLRPSFGAVAVDGGQSPLYVADLMAFLPDRGTFFQQYTSVPVVCPNQVYQYSQYNNANLGNLSFNYIVRDDVSLQCFHIQNGNIYSPNVCGSQQP